MKTSELTNALIIIRDRTTDRWDKEVLAEACNRLVEMEERVGKESKDEHEEWTEHDGAEQRWSRLKPMVRDEFIREAKAAARALGVERI